MTYNNKSEQSSLTTYQTDSDSFDNDSESSALLAPSGQARIQPLRSYASMLVLNSQEQESSVPTSDSISDSPTTITKSLFVGYTTFFGLSFSATMTIIGDLACYRLARKIIDPDYIPFDKYDWPDLMVYGSILAHAVSLIRARLEVLPSRAKKYFEEVITYSSEPWHARLMSAVSNITLTDISILIYAISEAFLIEGSTVIAFEKIFDVLAQYIGLSSTFSWSCSLAVSTIALPALILNMLNYIHETLTSDSHSSNNFKNLSRKWKALILSVTIPTSLSSTLNDMINFNEIYMVDMKNIYRESALTKNIIYGFMGVFALSAMYVRIITWLPRLTEFLPQMKEYYFSNKSSRNSNVVVKNGDKTSFAIASELLVGIFRGIVSFFNLDSALTLFFALFLSKYVGAGLALPFAVVSSLVSALAILSTFYKMSPSAPTVILPLNITDADIECVTSSPLCPLPSPSPPWLGYNRVSMYGSTANRAETPSLSNFDDNDIEFSEEQAIVALGQREAKVESSRDWTSCTIC